MLYTYWIRIPAYYLWFPGVLAIWEKRNKNFLFEVINIMQFHSKCGKKVVYILWHLVKLNYTTENILYLAQIVGFNLYNIYQQCRWEIYKFFFKYIIQVKLINVRHCFWKYFYFIYVSYYKTTFKKKNVIV